MQDEDDPFYPAKKKTGHKACGCRCHGDTYVGFCLECFHRHKTGEERRDDMIMLRDFGTDTKAIRLDT